MIINAKAAWSDILITAPLKDRADLCRLLEALTEVAPCNYVDLAIAVRRWVTELEHHPSLSAIDTRVTGDLPWRAKSVLRSLNLGRPNNEGARTGLPLLQRWAASFLMRGIRAMDRGRALLAHALARVSPEKIAVICPSLASLAGNPTEEPETSKPL